MNYGYNYTTDQDQPAWFINQWNNFYNSDKNENIQDKDKSSENINHKRDSDKIETNGDSNRKNNNNENNNMNENNTSEDATSHNSKDSERDLKSLKENLGKSETAVTNEKAIREELW